MTVCKYCKKPKRMGALSPENYHKACKKANSQKYDLSLGKYPMTGIKGIDSGWGGFRI